MIQAAVFGYTLAKVLTWETTILILNQFSTYSVPAPVEMNRVGGKKHAECLYFEFTFTLLFITKGKNTSFMVEDHGRQQVLHDTMH